MQAYILAFFAVDVNGDALRQTQGLAIGGFDVLQIGSEDVVGFSGGQSLGEFSVVIGLDLPFRLLIFGTADQHGNAVDRAVVWPPHGSDDHGIGFLFFFLSGQ